jgi:hypothetical protein
LHEYSHWHFVFFIFFTPPLTGTCVRCSARQLMAGCT